MISQAIINLGIVGATFLILLIYLIRFVLRYKHEYESNPLCTLTVVFCLIVVLLVTFVLPVDIFLVSFVKETNGDFKVWAKNSTLANIDTAVFGVYYALYGIITLLIFIVIPFLHFLNEESESNASDRMFRAVKYTFGFTVLMGLILTLGAFISNTNDLDPNLIFNKIIHKIDGTKLQNALNLILTLITTAGFINVTFYTASGIFSWPIGLFLGTSSVANRFTAMNDREVLLRMRINNLQEKSRGPGLTPAERVLLTEAENDLRDLEREEVALTDYSDSLIYKCRKFIRPLQILVGVVFGLLSLFLVVTLILVNIDRLLNGPGAKEGYILLEPKIFNPLEYVLTKLQDLIFIGPLPLLIITCFLVVATISGMRNLGLWFIFARLHRIKVRRTQPQALLFFCISLMVTALAFNLTLYSMTSQYVTFGSQNFNEKDSNGTLVVKPCTLIDYNSDCILTRSSILLMRMMSQVWIFGAVFYWASWVFVLVASLSFIAYLARGKRNATHGIVTVDEFED